MDAKTATKEPDVDGGSSGEDVGGSPSSMGNNYKFCFFFTRKFGSSEAQPPGDIKDAFAGYADRGGHMIAAQLRRFLVEEQGEAGATLVDAERIVEQLRQGHRLAKFSRSALGLDDFLLYLLSDELNPPIRTEVHQDMTASLSHYYVYTGHNSYLTGNQLSSDCSDAPIIMSLQKGVRVIELDMWPNDSNEDVHILHGRTLTSPVEMIRCLRSIKEYAFRASPYPVVITLEDHLTPDLQAKVAEMVTRTFGDILYYPQTQNLKEFPSPEELKGKIIISTKPPKEYLESKASKDKEDGVHKGKNSKEEESWGAEITDLRTLRDKKNAQRSYGQDQDDEDSDEDDDDEQPNSAPEYKQIITIHAGKPKGQLQDALKVDPEKVRRLSLSEQKLEKAAESYGADLVRFTQRNLLRIYPKGTRFNSSNYNPIVGWMHGAQMVAFNMQGYGRSLWLMQGFFRANGGCGYVKKPDFLLRNGPHGNVFDPEANLPVKKTLKVKIYMGDGWRSDFSKKHFDTFSPPDFYAKVGIAGVPADCAMKKTHTIEDDWVPIWNEEFSFRLTVPELALLRIEVHDDDMSEKDDFGGQTCLPVWELRPGIRAVPLHDRMGNKYKSVRLLVRFRFG